MNIIWLAFATFLICVWRKIDALPTRNFSSPSAVDATLTSGAVGEDVVEACIEKLHHLAVFPNDFGFMYRIAKVETDFGTNFGTASLSRGIWQVPVSQVSSIQSNLQDPAISSVVLAISSYYGAQFVDFGNFDMTIPFHSAIAARVYIQLVLNSTTAATTLGSVENQAAWWTLNYRTSGDQNQFVTTINNHEATKGCSAKAIDLWFLLDDSSSVGDRHFETGLEFVRQMARKFVISPTNFRVGMSLFSSTTTTISRLNEYTDNVAFESAVNSTIHQRGRTFTEAAINDVIDNGFTVVNGARAISEGVPRVLVLLTDGYSSDDATAAAARATSVGITTFAIGIGEGIEVDEINTIASYPSSTYAYNVELYDDLVNALLQRLPLQLCKVSAVVLSGSSTFTSASPSNPGYAFAIAPVFTSTTIEVSSVNGESATVYFSSIPNPTSSLHIATATITPGVPLTLIVTANAPSTRNSGLVQEISVTGFQSSSTRVPFYISAIPINADVRLEFEIILMGRWQLDSKTERCLRCLLVKEEEATTSTTTTTTTTTPSVVSQSIDNQLEWWAVLAIVLAVLFFVFLFICLCLLAIGISRSSKYPTCSESCVYSFCACVAKSATY